MMIQDEELRLLYQETNLTRLQKLQAGLLQLEQAPDDPKTLEDVRQELHSLKGDSNCLGLDVIAAVAQELEAVLKALHGQQIEFTLEVSDCLYQGIYIVEQLIGEAITGEPSDLEGEQTLSSLKTTIASIMSAPAAVQCEAIYIEDDELREIYRITSAERLQALDESLIKLEHGVADAQTWETLRRQTHSLKGDSRAVGLESMGTLIQLIEDVIKDGQNQSRPFTSEVGNYLRDGLATVNQLIYSSTSGEPSGIDIDQTLAKFTDAAAVLLTPSPAAAAIAPLSVTTVAASAAATVTIAPDPDILDPSAIAVVPPELAIPPDPTVGSSADLIVDAELRDIYQTTSAERLQRLEASLLHLEKHPHDNRALSTLLRETHSLKGDARSAGVEPVETVAHAMEDVLSNIQLQTLAISTVSDRLYEGLDAIGHFVQAAVTGSPADVDVERLLKDLRDTLPSTSPAETTLLEDPAAAPNLLSVVETRPEKGTQIETVRIQIRDLEALTSQTEELAVTRIQIAQTATQAQQLMLLWEEWQANKDQQRPASTPSYEERLEHLILSLRSTIQSNSSRLELISEDLRDQVRRLQLLPMATLFQPLRRTVRDLAKAQAKDVNLIIAGEEATADKRLLDGIKDAILHLVRNAIDHGIETPAEREAMGKPAEANLWIKTYQTAISLTIEITDDGRGLDTEKIKQMALKRRLHTLAELEAMPVSQIQQLILAPGFSTRSFITEISGRGVGLDVVCAQVEALKGSLQIESSPGQGSTFRLQLSTALSTANVVMAESQGMKFAIPIEFLETTLLLSPQQIISKDGQDMVDLGDETIPVANLVSTLELSSSPIYNWVAQPSSYKGSARPCVVLKVGNDQAGFWVDRLLNNQEVIVKPMGSLLKRVRNVSGTTILGTGEVCMILNPSDLLKSLQQQPLSNPLTVPKAVPRHKPIILLVEDSPPVRIQEKRLFEEAGYTVITATNGLEGYNMLQTGGFDAVVSDVEMPHLDGFSLVTKIRQHQEYDELPIILVTTLDTDADRQRGADVGANAYIIKGRFNQEALLETLERLI
ncbi:Hpt domain-containing protein [Leptolyngbya cf. ectocarpi LEGE 11479]|uniref:histidine kinase n=1 Tax=Leptolyngbya cf. ectocarpi LEGE 11479 TaxID=1828722 RepID=A0A928ZT33_LEPEC|nr:Hpt domain-containing protein [Leptolyngbya ectocarpi]MBE9067287.1 Hpt domain-containing protein [Leptolyngbya cf. ectocarpi LEGE 11479]